MKDAPFYREANLLISIIPLVAKEDCFALKGGTAINTDLSFTGQRYDVETGLYYYKSRYYNPKLARFIQADTVIPSATDTQSNNRYAYVRNNPLKYVDPSGHGFWRKLLEALVRIDG